MKAYAGFQPARRLTGVSESATLKLNALVQAMKAKGEDVANLTAGEPDFNVPDAAKRAVEEALRANRSKYTAAAGIVELREAIARKTSAQQPSVVKQHGAWTASHVIVTNGGKQAIFNAILALVDPGDQVLIPAPYWLSYPEMAKIAGGMPVAIDSTLESGFKITPTQLEAGLERAAKAGRPRILFLNSPSNPTGAMYSRAELRALGDVVARSASCKDLWVLSDEIYDRIVFTREPFCSFLDACPELAPRTITLNGMSKSAAMTGWRVGWSVAPAEITSSMGTLQGQSTSNVNALAQYASVAALAIPEAEFAYQIESFRKRRDLVLEILSRNPKLELCPPEGAFYCFVGVRACFGNQEDSMGFAERLLQEAKVAVVPGTPFGAPGFIRLSFATDEATLVKGCERLVQFCSR